MTMSKFIYIVAVVKVSFEECWTSVDIISDEDIVIPVNHDPLLVSKE